MCWKPKIKTPKVDTNQMRAAEPAPLTAQPTGVLWGGDDDEDTEVSSSEVPSKPSAGKSGLKVKLNKNAAKSKSANSIKSKAFGKK